MTDGEDPDALRRLLDPLIQLHRRVGVFLDFDGTLSEIVDDPETARPIDGVVQAIDDLARRFALVAVISGRPVEFLKKRLPVAETVRLCGLYGLQRLRNGKIVEDAQAAKWRSLVQAGATTAQAELPREVLVERKGLSFALHFRTAPRLANPVEEWAARFAADHGLDAARGRMSVELGPFHDMNKGTVVSELVQGLQGACVVGDDVGDVAAFRVIGGLKSPSFHGVRLGVASTETVPSLLEQSDATVDGPSGALQALRVLAQAPVN